MKLIPTAADPPRRRPLLGCLLALAGLLAIGAAAWLNAGAASAHPGNTCDPEPGHGTPGCHVGAASTTDASTGSVPRDDVIPSSGPANSPDPNALQMFADKNGCLSCHGDPSIANLLTKKRPDGSSIALYVDAKGSANSVHRYKDCTSCHTDEPHEVDSPLTKLSLSQKCGTCHEYEYDQHKNSVHGVPLRTGNSDPATCTDCHSETSNPHNVVRVLDPSASTYPKNIASTCAQCHDNPGLMDKYGIVEKVYASYMRSFHGKAMKLSPESSAIQQLDTATCVSCHGAHNIRSSYDPNSSVVGMHNLLTTCQSCHPEAGPDFIQGFLGHKAATSEFLPEVYWGGKSFYVFSRAILAGGVLIVATSISLRGVPWIGRKIRRRPKKEE